MATADVFWGYPNDPAIIGDTITAAANRFNGTKAAYAHVATWPQVFKHGAFIDENILNEIDEANRAFFDITFGNFNVFYEAGYAIAHGKPISLTINTALSGAGDYLADFGLFDTIGWSAYQNADDLIGVCEASRKGKELFSGDKRLDRSQPLYLLDSLARTEFASRIISSVKDSRTFFRSFDPKEDYRMSLRREIQQVSSSSGVLVTVLPDNVVDHANHNLRAGFLSGLAHGLDVPTLIIGLSNARAPVDIRDFVKNVAHPDDIPRLVTPFCLEVMSELQRSRRSATRAPQSTLELVNFGASAAENEFRRLGEYFVETNAFRAAFDGRGRIVVGRKGSGKTAIFWQVRDRYRDSQENVVLDLKPDGYQLRKFKEVLVNNLSAGTKEHTVSAFWEYVMYLELAQKIIENDEKFLGRNPRVTSDLPSVIDVYHEGDYTREGDFSERLSRLLEDLYTCVTR